ncbi:MAG: 50S ribosomal protein L15, partial [Candidatus Komeilibacteria bacterium]|nr:50S ribosomal protein L15 [Candidatus Komeilibacteria bacterium]
QNLKRPAGNRRGKKRLGRGSGSGKGTYSTKGLKGQKARSGGRARLKRRAAFQQLLIRTPKLRGFKRQSAPIAILNLDALETRFEPNDIITPAVLIKRHLIKKTAGGVKILGNGKLTKKLAVKAHFFSASAQAAIVAAGGTAEIIAPHA